MAITAKQRFIPAIPQQYQSNENLENIISSAENIKQGSIVEGKVINVTNDHVVVDVDLKNEAYIPVAEFKLDVDSTTPKVGDLVDVYVDKVQDYKGRTILSRSKAIAKVAWTKLQEAHKENQPVDGVIFEAIKGGYKVDLSGILAFLPGSQVDIVQVNIEPLMGIIQPFLILKMDEVTNNVIVSRKALLQESKSEARDKLLSTIEEGMVIEGVVKNITDYGAFIDLGSIDGLLHVTDISWSRINHPSEILSVGQQIKVMVTKFHKDTKRVSLGMKQLDDSQWKKVNVDYEVGHKSKGKITNITDYGAFVELDHGFEGLVHTSEISWTKGNQNPKKLLNIGQVVEFTIIEMDKEKHRISLSIKQCTDNPWNTFKNDNNIGDIIESTVTMIADYGVGVKICDNINGFIHISDLSWDGSIKSSNFKKGDKIEAKLLEVDTEKSRVLLGVKQLSEDPYKELYLGMKKGDVVTCIVSAKKPDGIDVLIGDKIATFIPRLELSADKSEQRPDRFAAGDKVDAKIIYFDSKQRRLHISIKALEAEERVRVIKEYGSTDSGARLGDILGSTLSNIQSNDKNKDK